MVASFQTKDRYTMDDLLAIMALLRSPEGCPWDREQTHESIAGDFLEETHEALEAIRLKDARRPEGRTGRRAASGGVSFPHRGGKRRFYF